MTLLQRSAQGLPAGWRNYTGSDVLGAAGWGYCRARLDGMRLATSLKQLPRWGTRMNDE